MWRKKKKQREWAKGMMAGEPRAEYPPYTGKVLVPAELNVSTEELTDAVEIQFVHERYVIPPCTR